MIIDSKQRQDRVALMRQISDDVFLIPIDESVSIEKFNKLYNPILNDK